MIEQIQELVGDRVNHCKLAFNGADSLIFAYEEHLPFHKLGGSGLERLCFEILLAQGYEPRFFGRSGQSQYGIDLVSEKDGKTEVFQCKNIEKPLSASDLHNWLNIFKKDWIDQADLPRPKRFIICCPQTFRDLKLDEPWQKLKEDFRTQTGVEAGIWHLDLMEGFLKNMPDTVADLFSPDHAEAFCNITDWKSDLFVPLTEHTSGDRRLKRYFEHSRSGRLYIDEDYENKIIDALDASPVILVRGMPGTGKTFTSLAIAERYQSGLWRSYFLDLGYAGVDEAVLRDGIHRRRSRPSIFLLENCHQNIEAVDRALQRIDPELKSGRAKVICLSRSVPGPKESRNDDFELFAELESRNACVDFETTPKLFGSVVSFWRPEFSWLSKTRSERLMALTGRDLFLLDEILTCITSPPELDSIAPADLYDRIRGTYFGHMTAADLPMTQRLAALAQFEIAPRADVIHLTNDERILIESLCVQAGRPPRWHFLHSTAAELMSHALSSGMGITEPNAVADFAARNIIDYFAALQNPSVIPAPTMTELEISLNCIAKNRLKLLGESGENQLKAVVLDSEPILNLIANMAKDSENPSLFSICAFAAHRAGANHARIYDTALVTVIEKLLASAKPEAFLRILPVFGRILRTLKLFAPDLHIQVSEQLDSERFVKLIEAQGTLASLFKIVQDVSPDISRRIVDSLTDERLDQLVRNTIDGDCSIGTLGLTLRELNRLNDYREIGKDLARQIGVTRFLKLIETQGTLVDLFGIVQHVSSDLSRSIVEALTEEQIDFLIHETIEANRSISTLHMSLRELSRSINAKEICKELERKIGVTRFLKLIEAQGTFGDLFNIMQYGSINLSQSIVDSLTEEQVNILFKKTIDSNRSIGTLNLALRTLNRSDDMQGIGKELERKIGATRFLKLLEAKGTMFELFRLCQDASTALSRSIVNALTDEQINLFVRKTIDSNRSIGTLNYTFRSLYRSDDTKLIGEELERKIGAKRLWQLLIGTGTFGAVVDLIGDVSAEFRLQFIIGASDLTQAEWERLFQNGDFYQCCEVILHNMGLFTNETTYERFLAALTCKIDILIGGSDWYGMNTGGKLLQKCTDAPEKETVLRAIDSWLGEVQVGRLSFVSLSEAANGLELIWERRPDVRTEIVTNLWKLLPSEEQWQLDPDAGMNIPIMLSRLLKQPEFNDTDADRVFVLLTNCLAQQVIKDCRTSDIFWTLWSLFALFSQRKAPIPAEFVQLLPQQFVDALKDRNRVPFKKIINRNELRARFGLLGLLAILNITQEISVFTIVIDQLQKQKLEIEFWMCSEQTFVPTYLILRGIETVRPLRHFQKTDSLRRLLGSAAEYPEMEPAAEYLYQDVIRQQQVLAQQRARIGVNLSGIWHNCFH